MKIDLEIYISFTEIVKNRLLLQDSYPPTLWSDPNYKFSFFLYSDGVEFVIFLKYLLKVVFELKPQS